MCKAGSEKYREQMAIYRTLLKTVYKQYREKGCNIISALKIGITFVNSEKGKAICRASHIEDTENNVLKDFLKYYLNIVDDLQERVDKGTYDEDDIRVCSECGLPMSEGYYLAGEYACDDECCLKRYDDDEVEMKEDLSHASEDNSDVYYTEWVSIFYDD